MLNTFVRGEYLVVFPHEGKQFQFFACLECTSLLYEKSLQLVFAKFEDRELGKAFLQSVISGTCQNKSTEIKGKPCQLHLAYPVTPLCPEEVITSSRSPCAPTTLTE